MTTLDNLPNAFRSAFNSFFGTFSERATAGITALEERLNRLNASQDTDYAAETARYEARLAKLNSEYTMARAKIMAERAALEALARDDGARGRAVTTLAAFAATCPSAPEALVRQVLAATCGAAPTMPSTGGSRAPNGTHTASQADVDAVCVAVKGLNEPASRAQVMAATGIADEAIATAALTAAVTAGRLVKTGIKRGTRYIAAI